MNYETIKSFILFVLVGISLLLSFILWSYQPNYDYFHDTNYVNEVDIGGQEKTKNELVEPIKMVFKNGDMMRSFIDPKNRSNLYKKMASWVMYDYHLTKATGRPTDDKYVELVFPTTIPGELLRNLFTFNDDFDPPEWSFDRVFMALDEESKSVKVIILSKDQDKQLTARIDKSEIYQLLQAYMVDESEVLHENIMVGEIAHPIYMPANKVDLAKQTVIATSIDPDLFINALFTKPSLVTRNTGEAYFTDGQRGMRIAGDGKRLEYINPLQSNYERLTTMELIEKSVNNINEHKGWTNNYMFDYVNRMTNNIRYRLTYDGFPVYDQHKLSMMEQEWREQDLYQYNRPLIQIGNLLNTEEVRLSSGAEVKSVLMENKKRFNLENIRDIRVGYFLRYENDTRSLTFVPSWFLVYDNDWIKFDIDELELNDFKGEED